MVNVYFYCVFIGASGLGKSTLVNTLFKAKLSRSSCIAQPFVIPKTVEIKTVSHGKQVIMYFS